MEKLTGYIYRNDILGDCSNNGISNNYDKVVCYFLNENETIDQIKEPESNAVVLVERWLWGEPHFYFRPVKEAPKGNLGYMMGGCYVGSCSGVFSQYTKGQEIVPLHDRAETQRQYDMLSH